MIHSGLRLLGGAESLLRMRGKSLKQLRPALAFPAAFGSVGALDYSAFWVASKLGH